MLTAFNFPPHVAYTELEKRYNGLTDIQLQIPIVSNGRLMPTMRRSRELPMPNITKLSSLDQAHATLLHCWTRLSRFAYDYTSPLTPSSSSQASPGAEERQNFRLWLEHWEAAFTDFLTNAMPSMTNEDVTESRVLKANHLACLVLANDGLTSSGDATNADLNAIVELAGAVLRLRYLADSPRDTKSDSSPSTTIQMDVIEPLHVVITHCNQENIRARALELLSRFYTASS